MVTNDRKMTGTRTADCGPETLSARESPILSDIVAPGAGPEGTRGGGAHAATVPEATAAEDAVGGWCWISA
jgi:hypothetical protein